MIFVIFGEDIKIFVQYLFVQFVNFEINSKPRIVCFIFLSTQIIVINQ